MAVPQTLQIRGGTTLSDLGFLLLAVVRDPATVIVLRVVVGFGERQANTVYIHKVDTFASRSSQGTSRREGRHDLGRVGVRTASSLLLAHPGRSFCLSCSSGVLVTQEGGSDVVSTVVTEEACTGFALPQWLGVPPLVVAPAAPVVSLATNADLRRSSGSPAGADTLPPVRGWVVLAAGVVFCAVTSFLGDTSLLMGAVTQSWVPYVAVPFAMGFVAVRTTVVRAGLLGVLSSLILVVAFYAVSPFDIGGYPVDTASIYYEYGPIGLVTGFLLAALARSLAPRAATAPGRCGLACCFFLTLAVIATWALFGWGVVEVVTSSGIVVVGASTADVVASSAIVLAFSCAVIVFVIYGLPGSTGQRSPTEQPLSLRGDHRGERGMLP